MAKFITRRLAHAVLVIIAATLLIYLGLFVLGDPFSSTGEKTIPPETQAALREKFGLDQPFFVQYLTFLQNMFTFDFGVDFEQRRDVADMIGAAVPATARLALVAIVIEIIIGLTAGIIAAVSQYTFRDVLITILTTLGIGIPVFVIGIGIRAALSGVWFFPAVPRGLTEVPWYQEVILPAIALAILDAAFIARLMRGSMLEVLRADFIRTARAKGISERKVIGKHAFRNSIIPVITYTGISLGVLMGGALITERIFEYKGAGNLLVQSISQHNNPVIVPLIVYAVLIFVVLSMLVDIMYAYLDPRIRLH